MQSGTWCFWTLQGTKLIAYGVWDMGGVIVHVVIRVIFFCGECV